MVDFESSANVFARLGVNVVAASTDSVDEARDLASGLRLQAVELLAEVDAQAVVDATGAFMQSGERTFLHATGFLLDPAGSIVNATYSTGPIGRLAAEEVARRVAGELRRLEASEQSGR